ncbi:MAG: hypothetical protein LZF61_00235 [Nitrosomonas sp.]|nr:MAG: hypothetical protein LZF61_00235 [Nitrosomonas sp.]
MVKFPVYPVIFLLVVSMLTNGLTMSFRSEVIAHELDHIRYSLSADPAKHLEMHRDTAAWDGLELDAATHLCLHSAGQYQPFFYHSLPYIPELTAAEALVSVISTFIPEIILDLPLRPPRHLA